MMTFQLSNDLRNQLLGKIPGIQTSEGSTFARYDRIAIDTRTGVVTFSWEGREMFSFAPDNFSSGQILTLLGVEGRTQISVVN